MDWLTRFDIKEVDRRDHHKRTGKGFRGRSQPELLQRIRMAIILPMGSLSGVAASILLECKTRGIPG